MIIKHASSDNRRLVAAVSLIGLALLASGCEQTTIIANDVKDYATGSSYSRAVSVLVSKGPVHGASCSLFTSGNIRMAGPVVSKKGVVDFGDVEFLAQGDPYYVSCSGGNYTDEASGESLTLSTLRGGQIMSGDTIQFVVTPVTEVAYRKSSNDLTKVDEYNAKVGKTLGLSESINPATTIPTDLLSQQAKSDAAGEYGVWLSGLSQLRKDGELGSTQDAVFNSLERCVDTQEDKLDADCSTRMRQSLENLLTNNDAPVRSNLDSRAIATIKSNLEQREKDNAAVRVENINPATAQRGGQGPANWRIIGAGLKGLQAIKLNLHKCQSIGTSNPNGTQRNGVDCSNVTLPDQTNDVLLILVSSSGVEVEHSVPLGAAPQATFGDWSQGNEASTYGNQSFDNTVDIASPDDCSADITYSISPTTDVSIDASTGRVTPSSTFSETIEYTITASTDGRNGRCTSNTTSYQLTITYERINYPLAFVNPGPIAKTYGDPTFDNSTSCTARNPPRYATSNSATPAADVGGNTGTVSLLRSGRAVITATCVAQRDLAGAGDTTYCRNNPTSCYTEAGTKTYTLIVSKAGTLSLDFQSNTRAVSSTGFTDSSPWTVNLNGFAGNDGTSDIGGSIEYESSNTGVVTVDSNSGIISVASGAQAGQTADITATFSGSDKYENTTDSYRITLIQ